MLKYKTLPVLIVFILLFCAQGCSAAPEAAIPPETAPEPTPTMMPVLPQTVEMYRGNPERSGVFTGGAPVENAGLLW
jgi:hypothetical protein